MTLLQATSVAKSYGPVRALRSVNLTVQAGESHALLGANGAGKSTFVKIVTGVIGFDAGTLSFDGASLHLQSPAHGYRVGIASVFQDPALVPDLTIRQNLLLTRTDIAAVQSELDKFGLGGLDLSVPASEVPLPFQRMLDLARALAHDPKLLILDEITAALPTDLAQKVFETMGRAVAAGRSVLFISHRLEEVIDHCTTCTVFRDGHTVDTFDPREGGEARIVSAMLGDAATVVREEGRRSKLVERADPSLKVENLSVGILKDVSFEARPGEVLGVVAMEGQGQEELFQCLAGDRRPTGGTITVDGERLNARHPADAIRRGIVLVPADRVTALLPRRPIRESIALPMYRHIRKWGRIAMRKERDTISNVVSRLSIDTRAAARAGRLSGGNQQKLTIARWLAAGFRTLLLMDPTRGIDIGTKHQIYNLVREIADDNATVVMYTSELREVNLMCDRVIVLNRGRIVAELPPDASEEELLTAAHSVVGMTP